jgi:hypothetical protein
LYTETSCPRKCGFRSKAIRGAGIGSRKKKPRRMTGLKTVMHGATQGYSRPTPSHSRANTSKLGRLHEKRGAESPTAHSQETFGLRVFAITDIPDQGSVAERLVALPPRAGPVVEGPTAGQRNAKFDNGPKIQTITIARGPPGVEPRGALCIFKCGSLTGT